MTSLGLQRPGSQRGGFVPESLKEMKRAASCRKFNIGALSTPLAVKKMLSVSKLIPDAPTSFFSASNHDKKSPPFSTSPEEVKSRESATQARHRLDLPVDPDRIISRHSQSRGRRSSLTRASSVAASELQQLARRRRSNSVGELSGSCSFSNRQAASSTRRVSITPTQRTRRRSGLRRSNTLGASLTPSSMRQSTRNLSTPSSRDSRQRRRRQSLGGGARRIPQVSSNLDNGISDSDLSVDAISIDETVEDGVQPRRKGAKKSPLRRSTSFIVGHNDEGNSRRRVVRRVSLALDGETNMSRSSAFATTSSRSSRSRSSDCSAFCTPTRRSVMRKIEMSKSDTPEMPLTLDAVDDTARSITEQQANKSQLGSSSRHGQKKIGGRSSSFPEDSLSVNEVLDKSSKLEQPKKYRRSKSDETSSKSTTVAKREESSIPTSDDDGISQGKLPQRSNSFAESKRPTERLEAGKKCAEAIVSPMKKMSKRQSTRTKLPKRSKTLEGSTTGTLTKKSGSRRTGDASRMPARSKSVSNQKSRDKNQPALPETSAHTPRKHKKKPSGKRKTSRDSAKTANEEVARDRGPPGVIEVTDVRISDTVESFPTGYCEEGADTISADVPPIPSKKICLTKGTAGASETWHCTCGYESSAVMKCCGMCGAKRDVNWTCSSCRCSDNLGVFRFCGMCGDKKNEDVKSCDSLLCNHNTVSV